MRKAKVCVSCTALFYIVVLIAITIAQLIIDHQKTTKGRYQPYFNYSKHILDLRFFDQEYSKKPAKYIPGSGTIIAPRFVLTAAHLFKRGKVTKIQGYHELCGGLLDIEFSYADAHDKYKGKPPMYDIGLLMVRNPKGITGKCSKLKPAYLPKKYFAYNHGQRAIMVGYEYYYEYFFFTTRPTTTITTTTLPYDPRYYSSEYYSSSSKEEQQPCCSTPRMMKLLRRRANELVIKIMFCPRDINGEFFCSYEQNRTIPHEADMGTGVIDNRGRVIGVLAHQRWISFGTTVNFYTDVGIFGKWIRERMGEMLKWDSPQNGTNKDN